jgi:Tol biopolymer transport system component
MAGRDELATLRARYLSTQTGRFITRDSWPRDYQRPMSFNAWSKNSKILPLDWSIKMNPSFGKSFHTAHVTVNNPYRIATRAADFTCVHNILVVVLVTVAQACSSVPDITSSTISRIGPPQFRYITWSPDGLFIFATGIPNPPSGETNLYLFNIQNKEAEQLPKAFDLYSFPNWSPDGSRVALVVGLTRIWLFDVASRHLSYLTEGEGAVWSPKGDALAVYGGLLSNPKTDRREIRFVDLHGTLLKTIDVGPINSKLLFTPAPTLAVSTGIPITSSTPLRPAEYLSGLSWAPDGKQLIFSLILIDPTEKPHRLESYLVNVDTSEVKVFLPDERVGFLSWAPDGTKIAYVRFSDSYDTYGDLIIADATGMCLAKPEIPPEVEHISWSSDSTKLAFVYHASIHILDLKAALENERLSKGCS